MATTSSSAMPAAQEDDPGGRISNPNSAEKPAAIVENASSELKEDGYSRTKEVNEQEEAVGITAFVSPTVPGFNCVIKQRYTDFLVNEILPNGDVVHLTSLDASGKGKKRRQDDGVCGNASSGAVDNGTELKDKPAENGVELSSGDVESPRKKRKTEPTDELSSNPTGMPAPDSYGSSTATSTDSSKAEIIAQIPEQDKDILRSIFGDDVAKRTLDLYAGVMIHPNRKPRDHPSIKSEVISDKAKRTEAHVAIRRIFNSKLETLTIQDEPGVMSIKAAPPKGPSGARGQPNGENSNGAIQKGKLGWNELGGEYLHFTLYKENKDTMEALYFIATQLKVPAKNFQFAGTKDRRGVTVQRVAIFRVHADRIAKLNKFARGWRAGDFEYRKHGLDLGELGGNEFLLTLKDCHFLGEEGLSKEERNAMAKKVIAQACEYFSEHGFLNYYGLQRFGTFRTGTHYTGKMMLMGDLEGAVNSILAYSENMLPENQDDVNSKKVPQDDISRADAIRTWRSSGQINETVNRMPKRFQAEAAIMQYLGKKDRKTGKLLQDTDWQGALMQIQRNLRLMYVHAYQSHVWNTMVGRRWELYGSQVVEGDLVILGEKDEEVAPAKAEVDEDGEPIFHPAANDSGPTAEDAFTRARHLTDAEAKSGKYDIFDVVLPLPGFDVSYPANAVGKFYEEFMASDAGGGLDPHKMRRGWKDISLSGGYRKIMARPKSSLEYEVKSYANDDDQMVETDLERLQKDDGSTQHNNAYGDVKKAGSESAHSAGNTKEKIAFVLKMQLGSSQYATIALRELTKGGAVNYKPDYSAR